METEPMNNTKESPSKQEKTALDPDQEYPLIKGKKETKVEQSQATWGNEIEFFLASVSYSVGLGNIWRFPYLCMANGGASFVIAYFVCLFLCAMPLYFMEICLGQFSGSGPITVWNILPAFKGMGYGMVIVSGILSLYFNNIIAWTVFYLYNSFTSVLPWSHCDNEWNTPLCLVNNDMVTEYGGDNVTANETEVFFGGLNNKSYAEYTNEARLYANVSANETIPWISAAEEFWVHGVLDMSSGVNDIGGVRWEIFACMWFAWILTFLCFIKDISSVGKVIYVTATAPYVLLTVLLVRAVTLPGAVDGMKYYFIPQLSKLLEFKVWAVACLQVFYSLGPGWGGVLSIASFNKFNHNCYRDGFLVPIVTGLTSFYGGIVVFCILGFMANQTGNDITTFIKSGPGLVFIAYPRALAKLPVAPMWSVMFFLMVFTVGIGSMFGLVETACGAIVFEYPKYLRKYKLWITLGFCLICASVGTLFCTRAGVYYFHVTDFYVAAFSVMLIGILEAVSVSWIYGHDRLAHDIELMTGRKPGLFWRICWCFVTPTILMMLFVYAAISMQAPTYGDYQYPTWIIIAGWFIAMLSIVPIPLYFIISLLQQKGPIKQRLLNMFKPSPLWGPSNPELRMTYKYNSKNRSLSHFLPRRRKNQDNSKV